MDAWLAKRSFRADDSAQIGQTDFNVPQKKNFRERYFETSRCARRRRCRIHKFSFMMVLCRIGDAMPQISRRLPSIERFFAQINFCSEFLSFCWRLPPPSARQRGYIYYCNQIWQHMMIYMLSQTCIRQATHTPQRSEA